MAYPETNSPKRDPYDDAMRNPAGTDPHAHYSYWNWILGIVAVALIGLYVLNAANRTPGPVSETPASQSAAPKTAPVPAPPNP